jgi:hypothetical protein
MRKHLLSHQHFIQKQTCTPNIAFLVVLLQLQHLWTSVQRSASPLGHLHLNVSGQTEICDFELFVLIEQQVIGFEIAVQFICMW